MTRKKSEAAKSRREEMERKMALAAVADKEVGFGLAEVKKEGAPTYVDEAHKAIAALGASLTATRSKTYTTSWPVPPRTMRRKRGPADVISCLDAGVLPTYVVGQIAAAINNGDAEEYAKLCAQLWNYRDPENPLYRH